jgi:aminopeptidase N
MSAIQRATDSPLPSFGGSRGGSVALGSLSPSAMAKTMAQEVVNSLNVFQRYFGPYPYKRLAVTNIPYSYGQGWPTLLYLSAFSFLDSTQRNAMGFRDQIEISDFFRAHETSHQWWGHRVSWKSYHDQWLSEGFAQFSGNLYVQFRENQKEFLNRLRKDKEDLRGRDLRNRTYESLGPVWMGTRLSSSDAPRGYAQVIYKKGGLILNMLRMMLFDPRNRENPETRFMAMMQDFCQTYHNQAASTEDFKVIAEKHMLPTMDLDGNQRLDWFFNQYVYSTGIPEYRFSYQVQDAGEGKWKISGKVLQSGVPESWKNSLSLYAQSSGRTVRLGWLRAAGPETPFEFVIPLKPEKLSLNENEDILADIKQ